MYGLVLCIQHSLNRFIIYFWNCSKGGFMFSSFLMSYTVDVLCFCVRGVPCWIRDNCVHILQTAEHNVASGKPHVVSKNWYHIPNPGIDLLQPWEHNGDYRPPFPTNTDCHILNKMQLACTKMFLCSVWWWFKLCFNFLTVWFIYTHSYTIHPVSLVSFLSDRLC